MISPGCANCYAANLNQSAFFGGNKLLYSGNPPKLKLREDILNGWANQTKPKRHFVASMTDVFGEWVTPGMSWKFLSAMAAAPKQTFQLLTKRADHAAFLIDNFLRLENITELPPNIWVGVSVEDRKRADERIPILLRIPARVRFLSMEPMLERVDLSKWIGYSESGGEIKVDSKRFYDDRQECVSNSVRPSVGIHLVIFGGESGLNARPCNVDWIRDGVRQCRDAGVKVFCKQIGSVWAREVKAKHHKGGELSEFPDDLKIREFPDAV